MEMWCLDDIGGIAWIGLGHLLGREQDSTLQSGVVAPRLPDWIVVVVVVVFVVVVCCCLCFLCCGGGSGGGACDSC